MIIDDLDLYRPLCDPDKADPELVVDADRVLSPTATYERLKPVAWRGSQITEDLPRR